MLKSWLLLPWLRMLLVLILIVREMLCSYGGTSIEIVNTDAEGRMVLADGIDYVVK